MASVPTDRARTRSRCAPARSCAATSSCVTGFAPTRLRMELDRVPLWRGDHVAVEAARRRLRALRLPATSSRHRRCLLDAVRDGLGLLLWTQDSFAYADSFDEAAGRYRGLRCGQQVNVSASNLSGLLVRPERAHTQQDADAAAAAAASGASASIGTGAPVPPASGGTGGAAVVTPTAAKPKRFHGTVVLDSTRVGRDASRVADEMIVASFPVWSVRT